MSVEIPPIDFPLNPPVDPALGHATAWVEPLDWVEQVRLPVAKMQDVLLARFVGRDEAAKLGLAPHILTRVATAIAETTRNVVQHAGAPGELRLGRIVKDGRPGLRIVVADQGCGIENPSQHLEASQAGGLGGGLPGTRRLANRFDLESFPGTGTTVTMEFWMPEAPL